MEKYGLLGKKLGHSLSPYIHNKLFELSGVHAEYKLYETDNVNDFVKSSNLDGFNVTIPYKKDVFNLCDNIHKSAKNLGVVNCVDRNFMGFNTDVYGYTKSVSEIENDFTCRVLLLGCGGVGSMIAKQYEPSNLCIAIRNLTDSKIKDIKCQFGEVKVVDIQNIPNQKFDLIVNSTPVGMFPDINSSPIEKEVIRNAKSVYDTIYNPYETKLLKYATECGCKGKNGLDMLVLQAVKSHEYWYGAKFEEKDIKDIIFYTQKELDKKW